MTSVTLKGTPNSLQPESLTSSEPLSVVGICVDDETWRSTRFLAESTSLINLRLHRNEYRTQEHESIPEYIGDPLPDICLIDFDKDRRKAALVAERIHGSATETAIFAISSQPQPDRIIEAMRSGCSEYLVKPLDRAQLINAVARVRSRKKDKKETYRAQVLAFIGAKGGCGVTTLATQMGALLAKSFGRKTLLLDLHPDLGDAALYLGLTRTDYHVRELLENTDRMDADFLQSFLLRHSSGLDLIPAPEGRETHREIPSGAVTQTLEFLRQRFEIVLADLPPGRSDETLEMVRACDHLYIVTVAEVSAIRNVVRQIDYFTHHDFPAENIRIVLNRHQKRSVVADVQIERVIGQKIYWRVPNQYAQVVKTIHEGNPVEQLSNSEVTRNLKEWAGTIGKKPGSEEKKKENGGLLGLWSR